jgi:hypothetical protein
MNKQLVFRTSPSIKGKLKLSFQIFLWKLYRRILHKPAEIHKKKSGGFTTVVYRKFLGFDKSFRLRTIGTNEVFYAPRYGPPILLCKDKPNLLTNNGRDLFHAQCYTNVAAGTRGSGFMELSSDVGSPAAGDTSIPSPLTTNGYSRADATTKTHTAGTNSTLIEHTYTAATAPTTGIRRVGLYNASSGVTLTHSNTFTNADTQIGDTLKVSYTVNLG